MLELIQENNVIIGIIIGIITAQRKFLVGKF